MSEPRKNHLTIDGGQVKEDDNAVVASYKPIPESDTDFRTSKSSLSKPKEVSGDGAEERLLTKEDEAKITTRVDMADAKYVVGDHRNGDAKIELDANKRQFSGLTKEELMKYADDPFWRRLRWFMFVLFWALWLAMLAGAIFIIVKAPKCAPAPPRKWFEKGPLVEKADVHADLELLKQSHISAVFYEAPTYEVLDDPTILDSFANIVENLKQHGIKVIVDLTPNFVSSNHSWFGRSENGSDQYRDYFVWADPAGYNPDHDGHSTNDTKYPNNWVSTLNEPAWSWSEMRKQFYLHQYGAHQPDLNFSNPDVVHHFDHVLDKYMKAGAAGVRLHKFRTLLVNGSLPDEVRDEGAGSDHGAGHAMRSYYRHTHTYDLPGLDALLQRWAARLDSDGTGETAMMLAEDTRPELFLLDRQQSALQAMRPRAAANIVVGEDVAKAAKLIDERIPQWPAMKLSAAVPEGDSEVALLALLLPAAPVLDRTQLRSADDTQAVETLSHVVSLRDDASVEHGQARVLAVPAYNDTAQLLVCARWKAGHTGYAAVYNPWGSTLAANLTSVPSVPRTLSVHHVSHAVRLVSNYTNNVSVDRERVLVPPLSTVMLSYVPQASSDN